MNPERILADTSAWIVSFKKGGDEKAKSYLKQNIAAGLVVTTPLIILELLQGCKTEKERNDLRVRIESLGSIDVTDGCGIKPILND
jgi:predicted nucleic acid-binding protein